MNTTAKHTPGPWKFEPRKDRATQAIGDAAGLRRIADVYDACPPGNRALKAKAAASIANAALIAAAPTMLDELKHAWAVFNAQDSAYMQGQAGSIARLIAKTTGEPWGHFNPDGSYRDFEAAVEAKRMSKATP